MAALSFEKAKKIEIDYNKPGRYIGKLRIKGSNLIYTHIFIMDVNEYQSLKYKKALQIFTESTTKLHTKEVKGCYYSVFAIFKNTFDDEEYIIDDFVEYMKKISTPFSLYYKV